MTLRDWKQKEGIYWHEVARRVGIVDQNRLWRLIGGAKPKALELYALRQVTDSKVREFI